MSQSTCPASADYLTVCGFVQTYAEEKWGGVVMRQVIPAPNCPDTWLSFFTTSIQDRQHTHSHQRMELWMPVDGELKCANSIILG